MKSARVSASSSSLASSSRKPASENSGVRSSCEALAMNSARARSSEASCTRMRSNVRASWPSSSGSVSTIGVVELAVRDPRGRGVEPADAPREERREAVAEHEREDGRDRARDQHALAHDAHRRQLVAQRRASAGRPRTARAGRRPRRRAGRRASPCRFAMHRQARSCVHSGYCARAFVASRSSRDVDAEAAARRVRVGDEPEVVAAAAGRRRPARRRAAAPPPRPTAW